jgi:hypothetical protein
MAAWTAAYLAIVSIHAAYFQRVAHMIKCYSVIRLGYDPSPRHPLPVGQLCSGFTAAAGIDLSHWSRRELSHATQFSSYGHSFKDCNMTLTTPSTLS